jgi:hypothetical protein
MVKTGTAATASLMLAAVAETRRGEPNNTISRQFLVRIDG